MGRVWCIPVFAAARRPAEPRTDGATCTARRSIPELPGALLLQKYATASPAATRPHFVSTCSARSTPPQRVSVRPNMAKRRSLAPLGCAGGLVRRCPPRPRSGGKLSSRGGGRRRVAGRYRRRARPRFLAATAVHRLLQALLGLAEPRYRHHRLVLDQEGQNCRRAVSPYRWPNCVRRA